MSRQNFFLLFFLLVTTHYISMVHAAAEAVDPFAQEHAFHETLLGANPDLRADGVQSYYKKIDPPVASTFQNAGAPDWKISKVFIGQQVFKRDGGTYTYSGLSLTPNFMAHFDPTQPVNVSVTHAGKSENVEFNMVRETKVPARCVPNSYEELVRGVQSDEIWLEHIVTLEGDMPIFGGPAAIIVIEVTNQKHQPLKIQGMEIACSKNQHKTKIFFDFTDKDGVPAGLTERISCNHSETPLEKDVVCVKNHKMYSCVAKKVYSLFDSSLTRQNWVPDESGFYEQGVEAHVLTSLPKFYIHGADIDKDEVVAVLGEVHDGFYQPQGNPRLQQGDNNYIYKHGRSAFLTLPYQATYKKYRSPETVDLNYLEKVDKPHILIPNRITTRAGRRILPPSVCERMWVNDKELWQSIEDHNDTINFHDNPINVEVVWPAAANPFDAQESKRWCDAAQLFLPSFSAKIHRCSPELANKLTRTPMRQRGEWTHLTDLNMSKLTLENDLTWEAVFAAVGTMTQLQKLDVSNNHPIADLMGSGRGPRYDGTDQYALTRYVALAKCLRKLTDLRELHIQGLWLKPHTVLGGGHPSQDSSMSIAVRRQNMIIDCEEGAGIKAIRDRVCQLPYLKILSIDGIPDRGNTNRQEDKILFTVAFAGAALLVGSMNPVTLIAVPSLFCKLVYNDRSCQDRVLKKLVDDSADDLAKKHSLEAIFAYSPGGNCVEYFSQAFRERLIEARRVARAADRTLPALAVTAAVLE